MASCALAVAGCNGGGDTEGPEAQGGESAPPTAVEPTAVDETTTPDSDPEPTTPEPTEEPTTEEPTTQEPGDVLPEDAEAWLEAHGLEFDPDPRAAAIERFAIEYAIAASQADAERPQWRESLSELGYEERMIYIEDDLGQWYPGPVPLAIVDYTTWDGREAVQACVTFQGFAQDPQTDEPVDELFVGPGDFVLEPDGEGFVVHELYVGSFDCAGIEPEVREW